MNTPVYKKVLYSTLKVGAMFFIFGNVTSQFQKASGNISIGIDYFNRGKHFNHTDGEVFTQLEAKNKINKEVDWIEDAVIVS